MSDIKDLIKWCEEARALLGYATLFNDASSEMKDATSKVNEKLTSLSKLASQGALSDEFLAEFEKLALQAKALAERAKGSESEEKQRIEGIKAVSVKLGTLGKRIGAALPLAKAQDAYLEKLKKCQNELDIFKTLPEAAPTALANLINTARGQAGLQDNAKTLATATTTLEGFSAALETAKKEQKKAAKLKQTQREAMPGSLQKLNEVTALLEHVKAEGVGVSDQEKLLVDGLAKAKKLQEQEKWVEATSVLGELPTRKALDEASTKALKKAGEQYPDVKLGQTAIAKLKTLVDASIWQPMETRLWDAIDEVAQQIVQTSALQTLKGMVELINVKISWAEKEGPVLQRQVQQLESRLGEFRVVAPSIEVVPMSDALDRVKAHQTQKQIDVAQDRARELSTSLNLAFNTWGVLHRKWLMVKPELEGMISELGVQASDKAAPQDLQDAATQQKARLSSISPLTEARDWQALIDLHASGKKTLAAFLPRKNDYIGYAQSRAAGDKKAQSEFLGLKAKLDKLTLTLTQSGVKPEKTVGPLEKAFEAVKSAWEKKLASAASDGELDLGSTLLALAQIEKQALAADSDDGVETAKTGQEQDELRASFEETLASLANPFAILETLDPKKVLALRAEVSKIEADASKPWAERVTAIEQAAKTVRDAAAEAEKARNERNSQMRRLCQSLQTQLDTTWEELKKGSGKKFEPMFQAMRDELADITMLADTPSLEAGKANQAAITSLEDRLKALSTLAPGGSDPFEAVAAALAELKKAFEDNDAALKANVPKTLVSLKKRLTTLEGALYATEVSQSTAAIAALNAALEQAVSDAEAKVTFRESVTELLPVVQRNIDVMKQDGRAPDYCKALQQRLDAAKKLAESPDKLNTAKNDLDRLFKDVQAAVLKPEEALAKQTALHLEAQKKALLETQWKASLKTFKAKTLPRAVTATEAPGSDPAQVDEIKRMLDMAEESAKGGDHAEALRRLRLCEQRVEEVVADPSGPGIGSRRALPQNAKQYAEAAKKMLDALKAFPGQVTGKVPGVPQPVLQRITKATEGFTGMFDEALFDSFAATLSDGKAEARMRREAREQALEKIRNLQSLLVDHPVLTGLLVNTISPDMHLAARLLNQRLTSLEANIRRSVN